MYGSMAASRTGSIRVADILGMGDVHQVGNVVVAWIAIFVVHLPRTVTGRRANKSKRSHAMNEEVLFTHLHFEVARREHGPKGNDPKRIANPTMRTDLPAPTCLIY